MSATVPEAGTIKAGENVYENDTREYWEIKDLTSIEIEIADQPGVLFSIIEVFRNHRINMTRIISRPNKQIDEEMIINF